MISIRFTQPLVSALALALLITSVHARADQASEPQTRSYSAEVHKVVFQVSVGDTQGWNLALNNVKNVKQELGAENVDAEIVAYGPGIAMLKMDSPVANRIGEVQAAGVKVVACENTMKAQKLTKDDMLSSIDYVPAGVVELMKKQKAGYAYIRP